MTKNRLISLLAIFSVLGGFLGLLYLQAPQLSKVDAGVQEWRNYTDVNYGFSFDYPQGWPLNIGYNVYAKNLMNADLKNKKCTQSLIITAGLALKQCNADCVDVRILVGQKPAADQTGDLYSQLYQDLQLVKQSENTALFEQSEINGKKIYKIISTAPTQSLNGACPGPLYAFEDSGNFIYIFAGSGANASAAAVDLVQKIIASINFKK